MSRIQKTSPPTVLKIEPKFFLQKFTKFIGYKLTEADFLFLFFLKNYSLEQSYWFLDPSDQIFWPFLGLPKNLRAKNQKSASISLLPLDFGNFCKKNFGSIFKTVGGDVINIRKILREFTF